MNIVQYQALARRTAKSFHDAADPRIAMLEHAALGVGSDWGEVVTHIKSHVVYGKALVLRGKESIEEELGDTTWFIGHGCDAMNIQMDHLLSMSLFHARYDDKNGSLVYWGLLGTRSAGQFSSECLDKSNRASCFLPGDDGRAGNFEMTLELARLMRCVTRVADIVGLSLDGIFDANIAKLTDRFPDKYTDQAAIARADKQ